MEHKRHFRVLLYWLAMTPPFIDSSIVLVELDNCLQEVYLKWTRKYFPNFDVLVKFNISTDPHSQKA